MKLFKFVLILVTLTSAFACAGGGNETANNRSNNTANANTSAQASPTPAAPTPTPDELAAAASTYNTTCVRCHKADGTGGEVELEEGKKIKVVNLREHGRRDTDKHLADIIADGHDDMPSFKKRLSPEQINELVRYIRREFHGQTPGASSANNTNANTSAPAHK
ncbi:MAG TPA: cytochrome c [Pyrinomonadaceae bacterium]|nr:cytochrome c [Pyrinomonadaceae bacterium]